MTPENAMLVLGVALLSFLGAALVLVLLLGVPWQAHRRGRGFLSWFGLQLLTLNPVYTMILVAMLPNRAKDRLRDQFARELDAKLAGVGAPAERPARAAATAPAGSVGDLPTAAPDASLGDRPTEDSNS